MPDTPTILLQSRLIHAATRYDRRQMRSRSYNRYALAQYMARIDEVILNVKAGEPVEIALRAAFNDRLLDALLAVAEG